MLYIDRIIGYMYRSAYSMYSFTQFYMPTLSLEVPLM